jgi:cyclomaltodextrinase
MTGWAEKAVFYHIFPLGLCGSPHRNDFNSPPQPGLESIIPWLDHARELGATAILLGPVMESSSHGYDVADYFQIDRRLGDKNLMDRIASEIRARGFRLVFDGVFHHVGRDFWAFRDVLKNGRNSHFMNWFHLDFNGRSPFNDPFAYRGWNGYFDLVKLNLKNPDVVHHLFEAAAAWIRDYHLDGLRLDAADHLDLEFMQNLASQCRSLKPDFWLVGEMVGGDYNRCLVKANLDSVTNYECYKSLYSSHRDRNFFEIGFTLRRQSGEYGLYRSANLYTFVDNHDVTRLASNLIDQVHLYPVYCLLFTMPGVPSIYYGSEFGLTGIKSGQDDWPLRPALDLKQVMANAKEKDLARAISRLARLRAECRALCRGDYQELALSHQRLIFSRRTAEQWIVVAVSAEKEAVTQEVVLPEPINGKLVDLLNKGEEFEIRKGKSLLRPLWPCWARVLEVRSF